ncbi:type I-F CRISPR-associated protein Csy3 (plasmid) [Pseudomonas silesiensis]|uniref:type I-F CRISPR-associated protein Csy3 n=1 Tax=Pseudomonas silesiensis TaxID=1853130 RepID=UPI0030CF7118
MTTKATVFKKLPGVLAITRRINVTDCLFFSRMPDGSLKPLPVTRSGLRGTQNINKKATGDRQEVSNIQLTDSAKTDVEATSVVVKMGVSFYPLSNGLNSCALSKTDDESLLSEFKVSFTDFLDRSATESFISAGLQEVANRYARNIANGRWLWRNRQYAFTVAVTVQCGDDVMTFDALKTPLNQFGNYTADELKLGAYIASCLAGHAQHKLQVQAVMNFGEGMNASMEVYPSQNYLGGDKPKGFARSLYAVGKSELNNSPDMMDLQSARLVGQAALRDTKVANALRTLDTWYTEFETNGLPISVEPCGANLDAQKPFRGNKDSSFAFMRQLNTLDVNSTEGMFMIAALIRGGVYSEGGDK